jgi:hypothetical protein
VLKFLGKQRPSIHFLWKNFFVFSRDDDEDENATSTTTTKKRKSEVVETTKTLFSYFAQKNNAVHRRISGSHFFRAAHLKAAVFPI